MFLWQLFKKVIDCEYTLFSLYEYIFLKVFFVSVLRWRQLKLWVSRSCLWFGSFVVVCTFGHILYLKENLHTRIFAFVTELGRSYCEICAYATRTIFLNAIWSISAGMPLILCYCANLYGNVSTYCLLLTQNPSNSNIIVWAV